jgi:hypothetical protein
VSGKVHTSKPQPAACNDMLCDSIPQDFVPRDQLPQPLRTNVPSFKPLRTCATVVSTD